MACADRLHAFDFLLHSKERRYLSKIDIVDCPDEKGDLQRVLGRLKSKQMNVYAVDLSTDEALRVGTPVVRAVIPALQPFSHFYRARYLGHPRLYDAPRTMGYRTYSETQLNHWPQPFS
jgi:ribosomal protein S12 methylthiotransferase accessory factor